MEKLVLFFIFAFLSNEALGKSLTKRQAEDGEDLEDRYGVFFPNFPQRPWRPNIPNLPPQNPNQGRTTSTPPITSSSNSPPTNNVFTLTPELRACRQTCLRTAEYNPVCGTNMQTYDNPSRLACDQGCGVNVSLLRPSRCPASVVPN